MGFDAPYEGERRIGLGWVRVPRRKESVLFLASPVVDGYYLALCSVLYCMYLLVCLCVLFMKYCIIVERRDIRKDKEQILLSRYTT